MIDSEIAGGYTAKDIFRETEYDFCTPHYDSPLGMIYMAADDDVLKGVWFEGEILCFGLKGRKIGNSCLEERTKSGWIFILPGKNRSFFRRCRRRAQSSRKRYGRSCL